MKISDCLSRQLRELNSLRIIKRNLAGLRNTDPILCLVETYVESHRWRNLPDPDFLPFLKNRQNLFFCSNGEPTLFKSIMIRMATKANNSASNS